MKTRARDKFVELANKRVRRAIKDIDLVGNLSDKSNYKYSPEDVEKILKALRGAVNDCKGRFDTASKPGRNDDFSLD